MRYFLIVNCDHNQQKRHLRFLMIFFMEKYRMIYLLNRECFFQENKGSFSRANEDLFLTFFSYFRMFNFFDELTISMSK